MDCLVNRPKRLDYDPMDSLTGWSNLRRVLAEGRNAWRAEDNRPSYSAPDFLKPGRAGPRSANRPR
jgi:hypothetical protein